MKHCLGILFCICLIYSCQSQDQISTKSTEGVEKIDSLISSKSYFEARDWYSDNREKLNDYDQLRVGALLNSLFNRLEQSNQQINLLFEKYEPQLSKSQAKDLLQANLSNSIKLFEYSRASDISKQLSSEYQEVLSNPELSSIENDVIIWEALSNYGKQKVEIHDNTSIQLFRDKANLKNLHASYKDQPFPFIFDTGANLSTVIESQAKAMSMTIINVKVSVNTITGQRVNSKIGIAPQFKIGNMVFHNVVFLVFPDKSLYIPQIDYQIKGILGFPVIAAMREVHFLKNDEVYIPLNPDQNRKSNLAIEYLTPLINLSTPTGDMYFSFDTGADKSILYRKFFTKHQEEILSKYTKTEARFGGAGGQIKVKGYYVPFETLINQQKIVLESVLLMPQVLNNADRYTYGNIGQDLISKFDKMILNFQSMFIHFE